MNILAIDPGSVTTGWCSYDLDNRKVIECGEFTGADVPKGVETLIETADHIVIESLREAHATIYGDTVSAAVVCGELIGLVKWKLGRGLNEISRRLVKQALTFATYKEVNVTNDATAWKAMQMLHGPDCAKKGGALALLRGKDRAHARQALAAGIGWALGVERISFVNLDESVEPR